MEEKFKPFRVAIAMNGKKRIAFVISGLTTGGAEMMLLKLLSGLDRQKFEPALFSLTDLIPLKERFLRIGVPVNTLGMSRGVPDPRAIFRLSARLRHLHPHLIQTWMYHADLIGGLAARLGGSAPVVWNIRHSNLNPRTAKRTTILTVRVCALLSHRLPARIVCCADSARRIHLGLGYAQGKFVVIPNGFDLAAFRPDPEGRGRLRQQLRLRQEAITIGLVARFHPQKDHRNFIQAAGISAARFPQLHFVLCGDGISEENRELVAWIRESGYADRFHLLGRRADMPAVTAAFDIACSASASGEGFPNILGEAMACAVPCVATGVGDSASIIGKTGRVVPPGTPADLAAAWEELIHLGFEGRRDLGQRARQRIIENFSLDRVVAQYEQLYSSLLATGS